MFLHIMFARILPASVKLHVKLSVIIVLVSISQYLITEIRRQLKTKYCMKEVFVRSDFVLLSRKVLG